MKIRVVFLGTPEFACPSLEALFLASDKYEVVAVVTQPDRPAGRDLKVQPSRVKLLAEADLLHKSRAAKKYPILTPDSVNAPGVIKSLVELHADVAVVVAFGQILSSQFLSSFKYGAVNVHASLLPRWRGAAPIAWSILSEDHVTGVTLQKIVKELDAGDIIATSQVKIDESWDAPKLYSDLSKRGAELVHKHLEEYINGKIIPTPQDPTQITFAPKIKKEQGRIDWTKRASQICAQIRAFTPWPGVWTTRNGKILKILRSNALSYAGPNPPGTLVSQDKNGFAVQCGEGTALLITVVQPESRSRQPAADYIKGYPFIKGDALGT